jgi:NAD(P)-dependent dehydrogenase (short-subunit alcohol dehydrogenase family)
LPFAFQFQDSHHVLLPLSWILLGLPPIALGLLVGFSASTGPPFADMGYDLRAGYLLRRGCQSRLRTGGPQTAALRRDDRLLDRDPASLVRPPRLFRAGAPAAGRQGLISTIAGARAVADEVNKLGRFDAVIHNAGIGYREGRVEMEPGVPSVFAVNVLALYILTALIERPRRLVYVSLRHRVSSGTHRGVRPRMDDLLWTRRSWSGPSAYAESKLCDRK